MTAEEQKAADYLHLRARGRQYQAANRLRLRGSEATRVRVEKAWDALLPDEARRWEPRELEEARLGEARGAADESAQCERDGLPA